MCLKPSFWQIKVPIACGSSWPFPTMFPWLHTMFQTELFSSLKMVEDSPLDLIWSKLTFITHHSRETIFRSTHCDWVAPLYGSLWKSPRLVPMVLRFRLIIKILINYYQAHIEVVIVWHVKVKITNFEVPFSSAQGPLFSQILVPLSYISWIWCQNKCQLFSGVYLKKHHGHSHSQPSPFLTTTLSVSDVRNPWGHWYLLERAP